MSFLDDTKNFGIFTVIAAAVIILSAIMGIVENVNEFNQMIVMVGSLLYGVLLLILGISAYTGKLLVGLGAVFSEGVSSKFGIVTSYVSVIGLGYIIMGLCSCIGSDFYSGAVSIIIGLVALIMGFLMKDGKSKLNKVIFVLLAIIFFIGTIAGLLGFIGAFTLFGTDVVMAFVAVLEGLAVMMIFLMLFVYLLSGEVKGKLGM